MFPTLYKIKIDDKKMEKKDLQKLDEDIAYFQRQRAIAHRLCEYKAEEIYKKQLANKIGLRDLLLESCLEEKINK
jgi:hypothetical protein